MRRTFMADHGPVSNRRQFIGGSDARIIMGNDEAALIRLWREKRGELEPKDLSGNLVVQLGIVTEPLNRHWFECNTGLALKEIQRWMRHPVIRWMAATLDGASALHHAIEGGCHPRDPVDGSHPRWRGGGHWRRVRGQI